ncbi:1-phosphofructokinase family hexose kinase [Oerskovia flava]|uniref:1-phosphofructokinase family hexose kinase n=1 Tax=Oerskovia flava TaxID=2986422 RepID=UPI00223EFA74|nr:1-phosphofructokinase family hexose kinase [Oerskovia sp. JB1-3-2]
MILTVTPNPSLDRTYVAGTVVRGEVNRARATHTDAGGKGINVTRALTAGGAESVAVFPVGGPDGAQIVAELAARGIASLPVPVAGSVRSNITLAEDDGTTTKINAPGPVLSAAETDAVLEAVRARLASHPAASGPAVVVGAGSLPDGIGHDFYLRLGVVAHEHGAAFVVDTSGEPLAAVARAGVAQLLKPNDDELADVVGGDLVTVGDVVAACHELRSAGTAEILVSLGAHGALLVTGTGTWWAGGPALVPRSTVGAGDSTLAGYLSSGTRDRGPDDLRAAVAWGRAAVLLPGSAVPAPTDIRPDEVDVIADPDPRIALKEL